MPPPQCPFCRFMSNRPGKPKDHLMADHVEIFSPEILEAIKPLQGQSFVKFLGESVDSTTLRRHRNPSFKFPWSPSCSTVPVRFRHARNPPPPFPRCHPETPQPPTARPRSHYLDAPVLYVPFSRRARVSLLHIASFDRPTMISSLYFL